MGIILGNELKGEYGKILVKGENNKRKKGVRERTRGGGVGGFESGSESNTCTLECRVASNSPHSQGEIKIQNSNLVFFSFHLKKCTFVVF